MKYYFYRFWPRRKILTVFLFLVLYAVLVTGLRMMDTVKYDAEMRMAGSLFTLNTPADLWVAHSMVFLALPSYPAAGLVSFFHQSANVLDIVFPVLLGVMGLQVYADDIWGGMVSPLFVRMKRSIYYSLNGIGYILSVVMITAVFLVIQFGMAMLASLFLPAFNIKVTDHQVPLWEAVLSLFRWCLLYGSIALVAYQLSLFFGRFRIVSQLIYVALHWIVRTAYFEAFLCAPTFMACMDPLLNHPSMKVYWSWILVSIAASAGLALIRWALSAVGQEERMNETLL